jgi:hypothetical protein
MPIRLILLAVLALVAASLPVSARQLAVGAASGYFEPPGYRAVPVYTWPRGPAWTPVDTSLGYTFREPIYSTPRGYKYVYVRGYYWRRLPDPNARRVYRRPIKVSTTKRVRPLRDVPQLVLTPARATGEG